MRKRGMTLTPEMVALCWREEIDRGRDPARKPLLDEEYEPLADRLTEQSLPEPLWVFAYGSLIWKPTFTAVEESRATAIGWHRSFCLELKNWRGSPEQPGLMMALDRGGRCNGVAYRIADADRRDTVRGLVDREIGYHENVEAIRWIPLTMGNRMVRALVFYAAPRGTQVLRRLPLEQVAWTLARACGHVGSGAEYLYQTVVKLEEYGIRDRNLWRLQALVAEEIRTLHGSGGAQRPAVRRKRSDQAFRLRR